MSRKRLQHAGESSDEDDEEETVARKRSKRCLQFDNPTDDEEGEAGLIEKVVLKNFMCHLHLEFVFGPHVNFISGRNGTGKSAVLYGIFFALGGKPRSSGKNTNLSSFIHDDKQCAEVSVTLRNTGPDAYQPEKYGERIIIERRIPRDSSSSYKIKGDRGKLVSVTHEELNNILEALNIQVENPVTILTQDASKSFLNSTDCKKKYDFFFKGTQLERLYESYNGARMKTELTHTTLEDKKKKLIEVDKEVKKCKNAVEQYKTRYRQEQKIKELQNELCWAHAMVLERLQAKALKDRDSLKKKVENVEAAIEARTNELHQHTDGLRIAMHKQQKEKHVQEKIRSTMLEASGLYNEQIQKIKTQKLYIDRMDRQVNHVSSEIEDLEAFLNQEKFNSQRHSEAAKAKRDKEIWSLKQHKENYNSKLSNLNKTITGQRNEEQQLRSRITVLTEEKSEHEQSLRGEENNLKYIISSLANNNRIARYGQKMRELVDAIERKGNVFSQKPFGPIGLYITVMDEQWLYATEVCLKSLLQSFCCNNMKDHNILQDIMKSIYGGQRTPSIIVSRFLDQVHDVRSHKAISKYPTVFDVITCNSPVVMNCLIDQRSIESIVLIQTSSEAAGVMIRQPPRNCACAFTLKGDELYPNPKYRFYSCNYKSLSLLQKQSFTQEDVELKKREIFVLKNKIRASQEEHDKCFVEARKHKEFLMKHNDQKSYLTKQILEIEEKLKDLEELDKPVDIGAQEEELKTLLAWKEKVVVETEEMRKEQTEEITLASSLKQDHSEKNKKLKEKQTEIDDQLSEVQKLKSKKHELEEKCKAFEVTIIKRKEELQQCENKLRAATNEAKKAVDDATSLSGSRVETDRTPAEVQSQLNSLQNAMKEFLSYKTDRENAMQQYKEKSEKLNNMKKEVHSVGVTIKKLTKMIKERMTKYVNIRDSITLSVCLVFNGNMGSRSYQGRLEFDHDQRHLEILPTNDQGPSSTRCKTGFLSGGEKSFTTVAFLLALYDETEMPFHILDEYDVFMDSLNRDVSMRFMLEMANAKKKIQFIFLSPLDLPPMTGNFVQIHKMSDIVRGQVET